MNKQQQKTSNNDDSPLGGVFAVIGILAALAMGGEQDMEGGAILLAILILGFIGYAIGRWVEAVLVQLIFIGAAVIMFLMNAAIRSFIWSIISGLFGG